jgi:hypothetical protein
VPHQEDEKERVDRELIELLNELRVAIPGIQILFAFLLTVPFAPGFDELSGFERGLYFSVLLLTALSSAFLIAPTAYHRLLFRQGRKHEILFFANRAALFGLASLGIAMSGAILLITHFLFGPAAAIPVGLATLLLFGTLWYALPALRGRNAP